MPINNPSSTVEGLPLRLKADFGAAGDGVTDDTVAIQKWFTAGTVSNRPLFAEPGTYLFSTVITMANGSAGSSYGDGFVMRGAGPKITVFKCSTDIAFINFQHAVQDMILENFGVICTISNTHQAIHCDGTVDEDGTPGTGGSMNNNRWRNIEITGFGTAMDLKAFSNSQILNCSIGNVGIGIYLYGNCNAVTCTGTVTTSVTTYGYHINGGTAISIEGADITTVASGTAIGCLVDGGSPVRIDHMRCENRGSGYPLHVNGSSTSVMLTNSEFTNFGGTSPYGVYVQSGNVMSANNSISGVTNPVRVDAGSIFMDALGLVAMDYYTAGVKTGTWQANVFTSLAGNDGLAASASTRGRIRFQAYQGAADDQLQFLIQTQGSSTYSADNINQYNTDSRLGNVANSSSGNLGFSINLASGQNFVVQGENGTPGTNVSGGVLFKGSKWFLVGANVITGGDFGILMASGATNPGSLAHWIDTNGNSHIGWGLTSGTPNGTARLNIYGTLGTLTYTVAQLNALTAMTTGARAFITDAIAPITALGATLTGGGTNKAPVYYNGSAWVSG